MVQIRQTTARLRLLLAELRGREDELDVMIRQFRAQLDRIPRQAIYGRTSLDLALSAMAEIEERLDHAQNDRQHLLAIKQRAADELGALEITRQVEEAKEDLKDLKTKLLPGDNVDEGVAAEVRRLEEFIVEYSKRAERTITSGPQEP